MEIGQYLDKILTWGGIWGDYPPHVWEVDKFQKLITGFHFNLVQSIHTNFQNDRSIFLKLFFWGGGLNPSGGE